MSRLLNYFLKGLAFVVPIAVTVYVCVEIFEWIDGGLGVVIERWLHRSIPGAGFVLTLVLITAVGFLASNLLTRSVLRWVERQLERLPLVRLLYSSTRDLLDAFVGEKRRFDKPVLVSLSPSGSPRAFGFVTQESLASLGLEGYVAVYMPQSYGWAGNLLVFPAVQVTPVDSESADVMAFIISGGVTALPERSAPTGSYPIDGVPASASGEPRR